jgi:hypothetical protein
MQIATFIGPPKFIGIPKIHFIKFWNDKIGLINNYYRELFNLNVLNNDEQWVSKLKLSFTPSPCDYCLHNIIWIN